LTTQARAEAQAGGSFDAEVDPAVAIASASLLGVTSHAEFRIDPDDQDIEFQFSVTPGPGGFDSTVLASASASGDALVTLPLTAAGVAASQGTVEFLFAITGRMDIDGTPFPGGDPRYSVTNFNQLRVRVGPPGNPVTELIFDELQADAASALVFTTLVGTSAIPVDFSAPVELTIEWQGGASVQFADGDFTVSSDFLGTVGIQAVVLRDLAGNRIAGSFTTDGGRVLPVPEPAGGALVALAGLAALATRRRRARRAIAAAACAALLGSPMAARAAIEVDFTSFGTYTTETFGACRVLATSDGDALVSLGAGGLGVQGNLGSEADALDGGETLAFLFPASDNRGATGISYRVAAASDDNANGSAGEAFLEAFDEQGQSLGVRAVSGAATIDVSALFGGAPIQFLRLVAAGDAQQIDRIAFTPATTSGTLLHLDGFGFVITPLFEVCEAAIGGSSDVVLTALGLGIAGGSSPSLLDGFEWVRFDFDRLQTGVFYTSTSGTDANGNGVVGDAFVEGYGAGGASLGLVAVSGEGMRDVTALFGGAPLLGFRVVANVDAQRLSGVAHVPEAGAGGGLAAWAALMLLARRARRRRPARAVSCAVVLAALSLGPAHARAAPLLTIPCACVIAGGAGPGHVVVSPDGRHVYMASGGSNAVAAFGRAAGNGALSFLESVTVPSALDLPTDLAIAPDGRLVVAIGQHSDSLVAFWRDPESGRLGLAQTEFDDVGLVDGLRTPGDVAIAARTVYATSFGDEAVAVFVPEPEGALLASVALAALLARGRRRVARR